LRDRLIAATTWQRSLASAVEGEGQHDFADGRHRIAALRLSSVHRNGPAGAACRSFTADRSTVADAIEFLIVATPFHNCRSDFRPQIEIDVNPQSPLALKATPSHWSIGNGHVPSVQTAAGRGHAMRIRHGLAARKTRSANPATSRMAATMTIACS